MSLALGQAPVDGGDYRYEYHGSLVRISGRGTGLELPLDWAFGAGAVGFTAVGFTQGRYFEHRVSWLTVPRAPAVTPGQPQHGVFGVFKTSGEAYACFNCHSTNLTRTLELESMTPGIQCERCHGAGSQHIAAARAQRPSVEIRHGIFDGGRLPPTPSVQVCGECHRTSGDLKSPITVRFQPVGLMASRCFLESRQLSCITCHDPHADAVRNNAAFYAAKCVACHTGPSNHGPDRADCLSCHMRQTTLGPGLSFTDHRIRIYN